ncbi:hypothetical protein [Pantoea sp. ME81]|uniref:hypothetical protein n=1 Tax=Pantoea sp. ME81 TaxID=2743935 RepID=UPI0015F4B56C|nr:hypothetical protein [Pantoea sp. ME81]
MAMPRFHTTSSARGRYVVQVMSSLCRRFEAIADDIEPLLDKIIRVNGQTSAWLEPSSPFTIGEVPDFRLSLALLDPVKTLFHLLTPTKLAFVQSQKKQTLGFICESMNDSRREHGKIEVTESDIRSEVSVTAQFGARQVFDL